MHGRDLSIDIRPHEKHPRDAPSNGHATPIPPPRSDFSFPLREGPTSGTLALCTGDFLRVRKRGRGKEEVVEFLLDDQIFPDISIEFKEQFIRLFLFFWFYKF